MYYYLTGALKRRVIRELKMCFRHFFDKHKDILEYINHKYAFKQRPQKGIVVTGVGATPQRLSADNFVGTVISHAMLARVGRHKGHSIEWIREDRSRVKNNKGRFPSKPGIYYIEILDKETIQSHFTEAGFEDLVEKEGDFPFYFYVDPLYSIKDEPILKVKENGGGNKTAFVMHDPVLEDTIRLYEDGKPLVTGHFLELEAEKSLKIKKFSKDEVTFGLPKGQIPAVAKGSEQEPFEIKAGQNDLFDFNLNGTDVSIPLTSGSRSVEEISADIRNGLYGIVSTQDYSLGKTSDGRLVIEASESLSISDNALSLANDVLGFEEGQVPVSASGHIFQPNIKEDVILYLEVDGNEEEVIFYRGSYDPQDIASRIQNKTSLDVDVVEHGDFTFDADTGEVTIIKPLDKGTFVTADYKYKGETDGPFGIKQDMSHNDAIPGVVLAFGRRIQNQDKAAVVVHPDRVAVADEYGGRWDMSVDIDIITRNPSEREEITDMILTYFFAIRKSSLTEEGIEITDVSFGGEVEEVYDDTDGAMYYNSSISLSMQTDWAIHVPKPLTIERVTPVSFDEEAKVAGTDEEVESDLVKPLTEDERNLKKMENIYFKGRNRDFEFIK